MRLVVDGGFLAVPAAVWLEILLDMVLKGLLVLAATHLIARGLRRLPATIKDRVWTSVFALLLALPVASGFLALAGTPRIGGSLLTVIQHERASVVDSIPGPAGRSEIGGEPAARHGTTGQTTAASSEAEGRPAPLSTLRFRYWPVPLAVWLLGVVWFGSRTLRGLRAGRRAAALASPERSASATASIREIGRDLGLSRPVALRVSATPTVPFVTGIRSPVLVLPEAHRSWDRRRLRLVLLHELVHVRRGDLARLLLIDMACTLHWFNPLAWASARRAKIEIEKACDETVCRGDLRALDYARQLVWFARHAAATGDAARSPGLVREPGLEERVRALLEQKGRRSFLERWLPGMGLRGRMAAFGIPAVAIALFLPVTAMRFVDQGRTVAPPQVDVAVTPSRAPDADAGQATWIRARPRPGERVGRSGAAARPIHAAAAAGDGARIVELLAANPDLLDARDARGMTPLALAAWNDRLDLVELLIERGAGVDVKNHNGLTPLFCALDRDRPSMARLLIRSGADLQTRGFQGRTLLHMAARGGDAGSARLLIERGADVDAVDMRGVVPLDLAVWHRQHRVESLLLEHGASRGGRSAPIRLRRNQVA